jgi:surface protein
MDIRRLTGGLALPLTAIASNNIILYKHHSVLFDDARTLIQADIDAVNAGTWAGSARYRSAPKNQPEVFKLASNGLTVTCFGASNGDTGEINGKVYVAYDNNGLFEILSEGDLQEQTYKFNYACTSNVTTMNLLNSSTGGLFYNSTINPNIAHWDTSNVTNMRSMFWGATVFNQSIGEWDVSNVTDMQFMFSKQARKPSPNAGGDVRANQA